MIIKTTGYQSSDGAIHGSLELAQRAELIALFKVEVVADEILKNADKVIDILTMTSKSKPRARKINGGTKTRAKKSTRHEAEQFPLPMEDSPKPAA